MKKNWIFPLLVVVVTLLMLSVANAAPMAYEMSNWTVDSGGGVSQGGSFTLTGTTGQADAGAMKGGEYILAGGFWRGEEVKAESFEVNLPVIVR